MHSGTTHPDHSISAAAAEITNAARDTALGFFRGRVEIDIKGDESPVTVADLQIEREARDILARHFPDHAILGEEYGAGDLTNDNVWIIDPIDGTRSFISGHPLFGFLLAYVNAGQSDLGVVSMPALNEQYIGQRGQGATLNGKPISVSKKKTLDEAILSINEGEKLFEFEPEAHARLVVSGHTRRFGYDCYPHALLAAGHIDGVVDYDLKPFDYLPLVGLIEAAGGIITDWDGNPLNYDSDGRVVSAATPELHAELIALLRGEPEHAPALLTLSDGPAFEITNETGQSPFVLVCEHASNRVPETLSNLGLNDTQLQSHVAWDPGANDLAMALSSALDAPLLSGRFSRLVYDCNRPPEAPSAMPYETEACRVLGNWNISRAEHLARVGEIYGPFHSALIAMLSRARPNGLMPILVSVHSFTPVFNGLERDVEIGLLHGTGSAFAKTVQTELLKTASLDVRLNEPYAPGDGVLHTFQRHIDPSTDPHLMIEVRNDLLSSTKQISTIKNALAPALTRSLSGEFAVKPELSQGQV